MNKIRFSQVIVLLAMLVVLFAAGLAGPPAAYAQKEVVIGGIWPLSGRLASLGKDIKAAVNLALDIINEQHDLDLPLARTKGLPNLGGARLRIIFADHRGNPAQGRAEAERLITEKKVAVLTGSYHSSVTKTASAAAERYGVPFVNGESSSPTLTQRGFKWFFRTGPHDVTFSQNMLQIVKDLETKRGHKVATFAILSEDSEWGASAVKAEERFIKEFGYELVEKILYSRKTADLSAEVLRIKAKNPDVVIQNSYTPDAILSMKEYKRQNWLPKLLIAQDAGFVSSEFLNTMGADADYIMTRSAWGGLDMAEKLPLMRKVNELYRKRTGQDLDGVTARDFTVIFAIADAINRAGSTKPEAIRQALLKTNIPGSQLIMGWKGIRFDPKTGQNVHAAGVIQQRLGQKWRTVWPLEVAPVKAKVPMPAWDKR